MTKAIHLCLWFTFPSFFLFKTLCYITVISKSHPPITRVAEDPIKIKKRFLEPHQNKAGKKNLFQLKNRRQKPPGKLMVTCVVPEEESTCFLIFKCRSCFQTAT